MKKRERYIHERHFRNAAIKLLFAPVFSLCTSPIPKLSKAAGAAAVGDETDVSGNSNSDCCCCFCSNS